MFAAATNQLAGSIPSIIGRLQKLQFFSVGDNSLSGTIATSLGNLTMLIKLDLGGNNLQAGLSSLSVGLSLSSNRLTGVLPIEVGNFKNLGLLDVSQNMLSGVLPNNLGKRVMLEELLMNGNFFRGSIPLFFSSLRGLTELNISRNNLTGKIPEFFMTFGALYYLNFSYNNLEGPALVGGVFKNASAAFLQGNNKLCGGKGSFGFVYKGVLEDGKIIAIKVLTLLSHRASRSFLAECEALRNVRHPNLVKVLTVCSGFDYNDNDFKALVYEFMANGSLEDWLRPSVGKNGGEAAKSVNLFQRLNMAIDVGYALEYLHHHCQTPIVHCDLKPSNILLDEEMVGHVGDFGLAKFITSNLQDHTSSQSSSLGFKGTIGYAPSEYGLGSTVTTYGDVYSYDILLLEIFTGRRRPDEMFKENLNLHNFIKSTLLNQVADITDPAFLPRKFKKRNNKK
ncbi:hypothetical protein PTKIN_Ptkin16aG0533700 [Pterospermum kingtungense]